MKTTPESKEDIQKMQQDAIKRVREMQAKAKHSLERSRIPCPHTHPPSNTSSNTQPHSNETKNPKNIKHDCKKQLKEHCEQNKIVPHKSTLEKNTSYSGTEGISKILQMILKDEEKSLIIALLLLLIGEEDTIGIIFVLISLLM